jgi:hypothetical protein
LHSHSHMPDESGLGEYVTDHLGGASMACALLDRLIRAHRGSVHRPFLVEIRREIEKDVGELRRVAKSVGASPSTLKRAAGWFAEKLTRPKLRLEHGAPLGLFLSLEALALGVTGKRCLWRALRRVALSDKRIRQFDFRLLELRAVDQYREIERRRLSIAPDALAAPEPAARSPRPNAPRRVTAAAP